MLSLILSSFASSLVHQKNQPKYGAHQVPYQKAENEYESPAVQQLLESRAIPGEDGMRGE